MTTTLQSSELFAFSFIGDFKIVLTLVSFISIIILHITSMCVIFYNNSIIEKKSVSFYFIIDLKIKPHQVFYSPQSIFYSTFRLTFKTFKIKF